MQIFYDEQGKNSLCHFSPSNREWLKEQHNKEDYIELLED